MKCFCEICKKEIECGKSLIGRTIKCPKCGEQITVVDNYGFVMGMREAENEMQAESKLERQIIKEKERAIKELEREEVNRQRRQDNQEKAKVAANQKYLQSKTNEKEAQRKLQQTIFDQSQADLRYPALRNISKIMAIIAVVTVGLAGSGPVIAVCCAIWGSPQLGGLAFAVLLPIAILFFAVGIVLKAIAELIKIFVDIELNSRILLCKVSELVDKD